MSRTNVLVLRATGTQGRSVCKKAIEAGFAVKAVVTDVKEPRAASIEKLGVHLIEGSIDDRGTLDLAMKDCQHLFFTLMPKFDEQASELRQAKVVIAAALASGNIKTVVCSTALLSLHSDVMAKNAMFKTAMQTKALVESEVANAGFESYMIIRPGAFMNNYLWPLGDFMAPELARQGKFVSAMEPGTVMPLIDPDDIGAFTVAAFQDPRTFDGKTISLASEEKTAEEVVSAMEKASGKSFERVWMPTEEAEALAGVNPVVAGQLISRELKDLVDLLEVRAYGIPLGTFEGFLQRESALVRKTFHEPAGEQVKLFK